MSMQKINYVSRITKTKERTERTTESNKNTEVKLDMMKDPADMDDIRHPQNMTTESNKNTEVKLDMMKDPADMDDIRHPQIMTTESNKNTEAKLDMMQDPADMDDIRHPQNMETKNSIPQSELEVNEINHDMNIIHDQAKEDASNFLKSFTALKNNLVKQDLDSTIVRDFLAHSKKMISLIDYFANMTTQSCSRGMFISVVILFRCLSSCFLLTLDKLEKHENTINDIQREIIQMSFIEGLKYAANENI